MVRSIAFAIHVQPKASRAAAAGLPQLVSTDLVYPASLRSIALCSGVHVLQGS